MTQFKRKPRQPKAAWMSAKSSTFAAQRRRLRPENTPAGGLKARSGSEAVRMAVYGGIERLYCLCHQYCAANVTGICQPALITIHHKRGRSGLLLFNVRYFMPVCMACHQWIDANRAEATARGWLAGKGEWGRQE